jgi:hypothetical protein
VAKNRKDDDAVNYVKRLFAKADEESEMKNWYPKRRPDDPLGVQLLEQQIKEMTALLEKKNMAIMDAKIAKEKREKEEMENLKKKLSNSPKNKRNPNMRSGYVLQSPKYRKEYKKKNKTSINNKSKDDEEWRSTKKKYLLEIKIK